MRNLITTTNDKGNKLLQEVLQEVSEAKKRNRYFDFPISEHLSTDVGTFKSNKVYGICQQVGGQYKISLNTTVLERGTDYQIKEILLHELIHACGINGHKWQFHNQADRVYCVMHYDAQAKYSNLLDRPNREQKAKYKITCTKCGHVFYRLRKCTMTEMPTLYKHTVCGGTFTVEKIK